MKDIFIDVLAAMPSETTIANGVYCCEAIIPNGKVSLSCS